MEHEDTVIRKQLQCSTQSCCSGRSALSIVAHITEQGCSGYKSHTYTIMMDSIMTAQPKIRRNLFISDRRRGGKIGERDSETKIKGETHAF